MQRGGERGISGRGHPGVAERGQVLGRIKAEAGDVAKAAGGAAAIGRAVALRAILDEAQPVPAGEILERRQIGRLAIEMHREDRGGPAGRRVAQRRRQRGGVHREAAGRDVDQHRDGPGPLDRGDGRDRGMRHREDEVAGSDAAGAQRQL